MAWASLAQTHCIKMSLFLMVAESNTDYAPTVIHGFFSFITAHVQCGFLLYLNDKQSCSICKVIYPKPGNKLPANFDRLKLAQESVEELAKARLTNGQLPSAVLARLYASWRQGGTNNSGQFRCHCGTCRDTHPGPSRNQRSSRQRFANHIPNVLCKFLRDQHVNLL